MTTEAEHLHALRHKASADSEQLKTLFSELFTMDNFYYITGLIILIISYCKYQHLTKFDDFGSTFNED